MPVPDSAPPAEPLKVDRTLIETVLTPYREYCRYLQTAVVTGGGATASATGEFRIPQSWYIADTGHFNAIEFNLCYNQLAYVLLGQCIQSQRLDALAHWTFEDFLRLQLSNYLIVRFSSNFRRPMPSAFFQGEVAVTSASRRSDLVLLKTSVRYFADGGHSNGEVTLAILDPSAETGAH